MSAARMVKGSVLLDMVKVVRAFRDLPWDDYLKPDDWNIIDGMVIPTAWYPVENYQRIGVAVYYLVAKADKRVVSQFGELAMQELFNGPYKPFLDKGDPLTSVEKFLDLRRSLFNFSRMEAAGTGDKSMQVKVWELGELKDGVDMFLVLTGAHFKKLVQLNGGEMVKLMTRGEEKGGDLVLYFDLTWR